MSESQTTYRLTHRRALPLSAWHLRIGEYKRPLVIGFRGGSALGPENALETISRSVTCGVDAIEVDIRLTRDRIAACFHDEAITLSSGEVLQINQHSFADLSHALPSLARLDDVVKLRIPIYLDIKEADPEDLIDIIERNIAPDSLSLHITGAKTLRTAGRLKATFPALQQVALMPDPDEIAAFHEQALGGWTRLHECNATAENILALRELRSLVMVTFGNYEGRGWGETNSAVFGEICGLGPDAAIVADPRVANSIPI